jgi:hypothetical protein
LPEIDILLRICIFKLVIFILSTYIFYSFENQAETGLGDIKLRGKEEMQDGAELQICVEEVQKMFPKSKITIIIQEIDDESMCFEILNELQSLCEVVFVSEKSLVGFLDDAYVPISKLCHRYIRST